MRDGCWHIRDSWEAVENELCSCGHVKYRNKVECESERPTNECTRRPAEPRVERSVSRARRTRAAEPQSRDSSNRVLLIRIRTPPFSCTPLHPSLFYPSPSQLFSYSPTLYPSKLLPSSCLGGVWGGLRGGGDVNSWRVNRLHFCDLPLSSFSFFYSFASIKRTHRFYLQERDRFRADRSRRRTDSVPRIESISVCLSFLFNFRFVPFASSSNAYFLYSQNFQSQFSIIAIWFSASSFFSSYFFSAYHIYYLPILNWSHNSSLSKFQLRPIPDGSSRYFTESCRQSL